MNTVIKWIAIALAFMLIKGGGTDLREKLKEDDISITVSDTQNAALLEESEEESDIPVPEEETADTAETPEEKNSGEKKYPAPDFTALDEAGEEVKLSDYFGKPVVLNFWASWCPPCKSEMPDFEAAFKVHDDVQFLMVNLTDGAEETVDTARQYVEEQGYTFPILFDTNYEAATAYMISSIPTTYFLDREGNLTAHAVGAINAAVLEKGIEMIRNPA